MAVHYNRLLCVVWDIFFCLDNGVVPDSFSRLSELEANTPGEDGDVVFSPYNRIGFSPAAIELRHGNCRNVFSPLSLTTSPICHPSIFFFQQH